MPQRHGDPRPVLEVEEPGAEEQEVEEDHEMPASAVAEDQDAGIPVVERNPPLLPARQPAQKQYPNLAAVEREQRI